MLNSRNRKSAILASGEQLLSYTPKNMCQLILQCILQAIPTSHTSTPVTVVHCWTHSVSVFTCPTVLPWRARKASCALAPVVSHVRELFTDSDNRNFTSKKKTAILVQVLGPLCVIHAATVGWQKWSVQCRIKHVWHHHESFEKTLCRDLSLMSERRKFQQ